MRRSRLWAVVATAACMAAVGLPAAGSSAQTADRAGTPKVIKVADDYFTPALTAVVPNRLVKWVWQMDNTNTHNVRLVSAQAGVDKRQYRSANGSIGIRFSRRLTKVGLYEFVCTFHSTVMRHKIRVRRA